MPFSNLAGAGLENKLAQIIGRSLAAEIEYTWWAERKGFVKNSLNAGKCDVILGISSSVESVLATKPYYRSTYVFISRRDRGLNISSLADERLGGLRIGVHVVGADYAPPAAMLAQRGWSANLVGFSLFGAYGEVNPPAKLIEAIRTGAVDVGISWGPFAGYFAKLATDPLDIAPVTPPAWLGIPFTYDISIGVRAGEHALRDEMNSILDRECPAIRALLVEFHIPTIPEGGPKCDGSTLQPSVSSR